LERSGLARGGGLRGGGAAGGRGGGGGQGDAAPETHEEQHEGEAGRVAAQDGEAGAAQVGGEQVAGAGRGDHGEECVGDLCTDVGHVVAVAGGGAHHGGVADDRAVVAED